jgi:hypothetical protein
MFKREGHFNASFIVGIIHRFFRARAAGPHGTDIVGLGRTDVTLTTNLRGTNWNI